MMKPRNLFFSVVMLVSLALTGGCGNGEDEATTPTPEVTPLQTPEQGTPLPTQVPEATPSPTAAPEPTASPVPGATPTSTPEATPLAQETDEDGDGYTTATDCDDNDSSIHPNAEEIPYDGIDQDCKDGDLVDADYDGVTASEAGGDDCDDTNASVKPGANEVCDGLDNDCDGDVDEGFTNSTYYLDNDGDGYGTDAGTVESCAAPKGYAPTNDDCDDAMWSVHPDGVEICNGLDDDCDGKVDSEDDWDDNGGGLEALNGNCDGYAFVAAGNIEEFRNVYNSGGTETTDSFPFTVQAGGHMEGANAEGMPEGCVYLEESYLIGENQGQTETRLCKLCFDKGEEDDESDDAVWAVLHVENAAGMDFEGVLDNTPDDDDLAGVQWAKEESTDEYDVWYVSDSFQTTVSVGESLTIDSTITLLGARFVIQKPSTEAP